MMSSFWNIVHTPFEYKGSTIVFNCNTVNVAMHAKKCVFTSSYNVFSSWFAAGALAHVEIKQARAINESVIKEDWETAWELLSAVSQGRLSGSA